MPKSRRKSKLCVIKFQILNCYFEVAISLFVIYFVYLVSTLNFNRLCAFTIVCYIVLLECVLEFCVKNIVEY